MKRNGLEAAVNARLTGTHTSSCARFDARIHAALPRARRISMDRRVRPGGDEDWVKTGGDEAIVGRRGSSRMRRCPAIHLPAVGHFTSPPSGER